ncbi:MAG: hypothetical protein Q8R18_04810 [bacterium]|nr:hypothetical protein [bacterium]
MKRGVIVILLVIVFLLPAVSATISITGPSQVQYNIGEQIEISGYVQETEDLSGQLQLSLICSSKTYKLQATNIDLSAGEKVLFSQLNLPTLIASSSMQGICRVKGDILVNNVVKETASSSSFQITNDLEGSFTVDKSQAQLGDTITLTSSITDIDGDPLEGTAEIYFAYKDEEYLMDFVTVQNGAFTYSHTFVSNSAGSYRVNIIARDSLGNEEEFNNVESFTILDDLQVNIDTNAQVFSPGDVMNVFGDVKTVLQNYVSIATVEISLDDATQSTSLADSKFTQDIFIPTTIKSGQHTIKVEVEDIYGNAGSSSLNIEVEPKATSIENSISATVLNPQEQLTIGVSLYDQASDLMTDYVYLEVYDSKNKLVTETQIASEESITYIIPQFAPAGEWTIKSYYRDDGTQEELVVASDSLTINEIQKLDIQLLDNILYIKNIGNIPYNDNMDINVEGIDQNYLISRTKNLGVNETIAINLEEELPSGAYTISIPTGYNTAEQTPITIENGKKLATLTWPYAILAIIFLIGLGYLVYRRIHTKKKAKGKELSPAERPAQKTKAPQKIRLYDPKRETAKGKKVSLTFEDKQHSLEDFKQRTLEEIKRTEEKIQRESNSRRTNMISDGKLGYITGRNDPVAKPKAAAEKPSVFNLFDD